MPLELTWDNRQGGQALIRERLDRAMADKDWLENNPQAAVEHLQFEEFDRCPIIIRLEEDQRKTRRLFRFLKAWTSDKSSSYVVEKAWNAD